MSKIICDVCGTAYPETATQCPICGFAKETDEQAVTAEASGEEVTYVPTKGGRFSKRNVRRRNRKIHQETRTTAVEKSDEGEEGEEGTNVGLIIVVIALLLAIIAVVIYIGIRFFAPADAPATTTEPSASQTEIATIPCTDMKLNNYELTFAIAGNAWLIEPEITPADTTDQVIFTSANEKVAIVSEDGKVVAVGGGETVITVTCGNISKECKIICTFDAIEDPTEDATEDATQKPTTGPFDPNFTFSFRWAEFDDESGKWDTTLTQAGYTWRTYKTGMSVAPENITWTSDDPTVATIENGVVTAVAPGRTEVHAQYGDKIFTCIVRCSWKVQATDPADGESEAETKGIRISTKDATVKVNESFYLRLIDANDKNIEVQWVASEEGYITIEGNKITGVKGKLAGITVSTTYEGETYSAIVRINGE